MCRNNIKPPSRGSQREHNEHPPANCDHARRPRALISDSVAAHYPRSQANVNGTMHGTHHKDGFSQAATGHSPASSTCLTAKEHISKVVLAVHASTFVRYKTARPRGSDRPPQQPFPSAMHSQEGLPTTLSGPQTLPPRPHYSSFFISAHLTDVHLKHGTQHPA